MIVSGQGRRTVESELDSPQLGSSTQVRLQPIEQLCLMSDVQRGRSNNATDKDKESDVIVWVSCCLSRYDLACITNVSSPSPSSSDGPACRLTSILPSGPH